MGRDGGFVGDDDTALHEQPVREVERDGDAVVVRLAGELDLYNAHLVREALFESVAESPRRLVVDLARVRFIDSTALGVLIEASKRLRDRRAFLLASPGLAARRALEVSGLDRYFSLHGTVDEALAARL